jgi:hypothetical protein
VTSANEIKYKNFGEMCCPLNDISIHTAVTVTIKLLKSFYNIW